MINGLPSLAEIESTTVDHLTGLADDLTFIRAEKIGYGPDARDQALADSRAELAKLPA